MSVMEDSDLGNLDEASLDAQWEQWKITYKKKYNSPKEEAERRAIWEESMRRIVAHNKEAALGKHTFTMGMNHLGDLKPEEVCCGGLCVPKDGKRPNHPK